MKHFFKLVEGIPVLPIMNAIMTNGQLWDRDKTRTQFEGTPHAQVSDILLRFGEPDGDSLEAWDRPAMKTLGAKGLCLDVMKIVGGSRLGRVVVTRLEPGKSILPHADVRGEYSSYYTRYHLALQGKPGSIFMCGDENVTMRTGELWWFQAHEVHEVKNNSDDDRVHLLIDVRIDP